MKFIFFLSFFFSQKSSYAIMHALMSKVIQFIYLFLEKSPSISSLASQPNVFIVKTPKTLNGLKTTPTSLLFSVFSFP